MPIEILMPALSPTMTEGTLTKWLKKEGDKVKAGNVIAEIETDKATMEVEAVDEGIMGKIMVPEGTQSVAVNTPIALLLEEGEDKKALEGYTKMEDRGQKTESKNTSLPPLAGGEKEGGVPKHLAPKPSLVSVQQYTPTLPSPASVFAPSELRRDKSEGGGNRIKASPLAKRVAAERGVNLVQVSGTGPHGRIIREDVEEFLARGGGGALGVVRRNPNEFVTIPHSSVRKTIARRLLESKQQVPHFYLTIDCTLDALLEARKVLNAEAETGTDSKPRYKLSVNDFVIKAAALALRKKPTVNVSWYDDAMVQYNNVDVSVAVATESGLITPIIKNADQKTLAQISTEMKDLAARARAMKLRPEEFQGGGFSISNLGMYGIREFAAIINPPQASILAVGMGEDRVVVHEGKMAVANVMTVTLSVDHRAVDGALGAEWLAEFKRYVENPVLLVG